jgi:hypothetical protein
MKKENLLKLLVSVFITFVILVYVPFVLADQVAELFDYRIGFILEGGLDDFLFLVLLINSVFLFVTGVAFWISRIVGRVVLAIFGVIFLVSFGFALNDMYGGEISEEIPVVEGEEVDEEVVEEAQVEAEADAEENEVAVEELAGVPASADDPNVDCIKDYYSHFWVDELDEAYEMKYHPDVSFDMFVSWYENTLWASPYDFVKTGDNRYEFMVDLMEEDGVNERYKVVMEVHGGRYGLVETISSEKVEGEITEVELKHDAGLKAYVKWVDGDEEIHVVENGVDELVDSINRPDYGEVFTSLGSLGFSDSGRFLMYYKHGWEGGVLKVYDIKLGEEAFESFTPYEYGFTKNEKAFYECQGTGMHGGFLNVWMLPNFKFKRDLTEGLLDGDLGVDTCTYDSESNTLKFTLWAFDYEQGLETYTYYFDEDYIE